MTWPRAPAPVLREVTLTVPRGGLVWIGGRNGAGKTTLLRVAAGLLRPESGTVRVDGIDPDADRLAYQRHIGFVTASNTGLYARLTVRQHLQFWAKLAFVPRSERADRVARSVASFELAELAERRVDRLSMGQRQRVRLAMAFLHEPDVILLDEPRNSLDREGSALLQAAVTRIVAHGGVALWCSPTGDEIGCDIDASYQMVNGVLAEL